MEKIQIYYSIQRLRSQKRHTQELDNIPVEQFNFVLFPVFFFWKLRNTCHYELLILKWIRVVDVWRFTSSVQIIWNVFEKFIIVCFLEWFVHAFVWKAFRLHICVYCDICTIYIENVARCVDCNDVDNDDFGELRISLFLLCFDQRYGHCTNVYNNRLQDIWITKALSTNYFSCKIYFFQTLSFTFSTQYVYVYINTMASFVIACSFVTCYTDANNTSNFILNFSRRKIIVYHMAFWPTAYQRPHFSLQHVKIIDLTYVHNNDVDFSWKHHNNHYCYSYPCCYSNKCSVTNNRLRKSFLFI